MPARAMRPPACRSRHSRASRTLSRSIPVEGPAQWQVDRKQGDLHSRSEKGHEVVATIAPEPAGRGQVVGVADEVRQQLACNRLLRHRRGHDGVDDAGARERDAGVDRRHGASSVAGKRSPELDRPPFGDRVQQGDPAGEAGQPVAVGRMNLDQPVPRKVRYERRHRLESGALGNQKYRRGRGDGAGASSGGKTLRAGFQGRSPPGHPG